MQKNVLGDLIEHMKNATPDHIALTGDLVNLALPEEITRMREWLDGLAPAEQLSVILGNHDTYVASAVTPTMNAWRPYMEGDIAKSGSPFPYRRDRGKVTIIGANSGVPTLPFMATGLFDKQQATDLESHLNDAKTKGQFRVVMIHHPPFENATQWSKRLIGDDLFRSVIARCGAELILHGHTHIESFEWIEGQTNKVPVIGVPSASKAPPQNAMGKHYKPGARYNLFEISGEQDNWSCTMNQFGYEDCAREISGLGSFDIYEDQT